MIVSRHWVTEGSLTGTPDCLLSWAKYKTVEACIYLLPPWICARMLAQICG